eukprot:TRINITY_DN5924_c1_g2_i1.p3 TRINITY_DN5924_c1_g2~~TRINITY_DN5924_c1_g2_i1.p3  ORF type:complete len:137 (+),score=3.14 TRINITY_DN5924_c1_g2_i1:202-612(+)
MTYYSQYLSCHIPTTYPYPIPQSNAPPSSSTPYSSSFAFVSPSSFIPATSPLLFYRNMANPPSRSHPSLHRIQRSHFLVSSSSASLLARHFPVLFLSASQIAFPRGAALSPYSTSTFSLPSISSLSSVALTPLPLS